MKTEIVKGVVKDFIYKNIEYPKRGAEIRVIHLWRDYYRANIWQGDPVRIVKSCFIEATQDGVISCL